MKAQWRTFASRLDSCWCVENIVNAGRFQVKHRRDAQTPKSQKMSISGYSHLLWANFSYQTLPRERKMSQGSFDVCFFQHLISMETPAVNTDRQLLDFRCQTCISHCWLILPRSVHAGGNNSGRAVPSMLFCRQLRHCVRQLDTRSDWQSLVLCGCMRTCVRPCMCMCAHAGMFVRTDWRLPLVVFLRSLPFIHSFNYLFGCVWCLCTFVQAHTWRLCVLLLCSPPDSIEKQSFTDVLNRT